MLLRLGLAVSEPVRGGRNSRGRAIRMPMQHAVTVVRVERAVGAALREVHCCVLLPRLALAPDIFETGSAEILQDLADGHARPDRVQLRRIRSEVHTSELQSLMRTSYAVFCLKQTILQQHIRNP